MPVTMQEMETFLGKTEADLMDARRENEAVRSENEMLRRQLAQWNARFADVKDLFEDLHDFLNEYAETDIDEGRPVANLAMRLQSDITRMLEKARMGVS